jgi:hypothetical protein
MKQKYEIESLTLPNNGGTIVLIPEGIENEILKSILREQKNKIILLGNHVGKTIFEDYKLKATQLRRFTHRTKEKVEA